VSSSLIYKIDVELQEGAIFRAEEMEDKWDIDFFDGKLYFSQSWVGDLVFVADIGTDAGVLTISSVIADTAANHSGMAIRDVDFLVKTYIFDREVPHSLPSDLPSLESEIVEYSFYVFGRAASFASYEDTTSVAI
jgi:hypothetical protein